MRTNIPEQLFSRVTDQLCMNNNLSMKEKIFVYDRPVFPLITAFNYRYGHTCIIDIIIKKGGEIYFSFKGVLFVSLFV